MYLFMKSVSCSMYIFVRAEYSNSISEVLSRLAVPWDRRLGLTGKLCRGVGGVKGLPAEDMRMRLTKKVAQLMERERVCRVATVNGQGVPHLVPVCHVVTDGRVYFGSGDDARKVKNLEANSHIAV